MRRWLVLVGAGLWLLALAATLTASASPPVELSRSRYGTMWWSTPSSVNPSDGSIWLGEGPTITHMSAEGVLWWRSETLHSGVGSVVVNPADGSCWATDGWGTRLLHYSSEGVRLAAVADYRTDDLSPSSADGSLWGIQLVWESGQGYLKYLAHVDGAGTQLFRSTWKTSCVAVAGDGSAWGVDSATHDAVHVAADGTELGRLPGVYTIYALDPDDSTLWASGDAGLTHMTSTGTVLAQIAPLGTQVTVVPSQGTAWVTYQNPHVFAAPAPAGARSPYDPFVVHYASGGSELHSYGDNTNFKALDRGDGSVWLTFANGDFVHVSSSDQELKHLPTFNSIVGLNPSDHTLWVEAGVTERHLMLQHITADGTVLWQDRIVGLSQFPGSSFWADPQDGSCWVSDLYTSPFYWEFVHLSEQGAELGRRTLPDDSRVPTAMCISPKDGTWWVIASETSSSPRRLLHLSASGTELGRHDGVGTLLPSIQPMAPCGPGSPPPPPTAAPTGLSSGPTSTTSPPTAACSGGGIASDGLPPSPSTPAMDRCGFRPIASVVPASFLCSDSLPPGRCSAPTRAPICSLRTKCLGWPSIRPMARCTPLRRSRGSVRTWPA